MKKYCVQAVEEFTKDGEDFTKKNYYGEEEKLIYTTIVYRSDEGDADSEIARQFAIEESGFVNQENATKLANKLLTQPAMKSIGTKLVSVKVI